MSGFARATYLGGGVLRLPSGREFGPGDEVILKAGEGDDSDLYEVGGAATREEYIEFTGITPPEPDPEPEQQTAAEVVASITPDNAQQVLDEERSGKNRKTVIEAAEAALDQGEGD